MTQSTTTSSNRGFAAMDPEKQKRIASMGGKSQGKGNNPGNFANRGEDAKKYGRIGGTKRGENLRRAQTRPRPL